MHKSGSRPTDRGCLRDSRQIPERRIVPIETISRWRDDMSSGLTTGAAARLGWIEACRGIAATAVLIYHAVRHFDKNYGLPLLGHIVQFGHAGVDLFFVISGFIILFVHYDDIGRPGRIKRYVERRLTRILPTYWVALAVTVVLILAGGHALPFRDVAWAILPVPINSEPIVEVAWTLQYEFVFYAMFAVLIMNRVVGIGIILAWLSVIMVMAAWTGTTSVPAAFYGEFNLEFFAGMVVAYRLRQGHVGRYKTIFVAGLTMLVTAAVAEDLHWIESYGMFTRLAYGLPCTLIVLGAAEASRRGNARVPPILRILGSASYSLYLFHFIFIGLAWKLLLASGFAAAINPVIGCVISVVIAMLGGVMVSRLAEYPLMHFIRDALHRPGLGKAAIIAPHAPLS